MTMAISPPSSTRGHCIAGGRLWGISTLTGNLRFPRQVRLENMVWFDGAASEDAVQMLEKLSRPSHSMTVKHMTFTISSHAWRFSAYECHGGSTLVPSDFRTIFTPSSASTRGALQRNTVRTSWESMLQPTSRHDYAVE